MLFEGSLGLCVPNLTLLVREVGPSETDDFGQSAVVGLYLGRDMLTLDERRSKEDESVRRARDVILGLLLAMRRFLSGTIGRRGEESAVGKGSGVVGYRCGRIIISEGSDCLGKRYSLGGGDLYRGGPSELGTI
jgi:hypothetical protein